MRALFLCLTLFACEDTTTVSSDLSVLADLSANKPDRVALLSCAGTESCITGSCTMANLNTCVPDCIAQLDPAAQSYFDALRNCAGPACTVVDGGAGPCVNPGAAACQSCVMTNCTAELNACLSH